jgi:hypothetical protein
MPKIIYKKNSRSSFIIHKYTFIACRSVTLLLQGNSWRCHYLSGKLIRSHRLCDFRNRWRCKAPIILGQPFLSIAKTIIYADIAKICFIIKDKKEKFLFKNRILQSPAHPQKVYLPKKQQWPRRRTIEEGGRTRLDTLQSEYNHLLASPFLAKKDDLAY